MWCTEMMSMLSKSLWTCHRWEMVRCWWQRANSGLVLACYGAFSGKLLHNLLNKFITLWHYCRFKNHWDRVVHICVNKLTIIGSDNGLSPGRHQTITWTNAGLLLIEPLGKNFSETLIENFHFHSRKCIWKCRLDNCVHFVSASMC